MILLVRHGERADMCLKESQKILIRDDPHLTPQGCQQAEKAGRKILKNIDSLRKIKIYSSPFLRCMMTAQNIAKELPSCKTISVKTEICESLYNYLFESDPLPNLLYNTNSKHNLFQKNDIKFIDEQIKKADIYPETFNEVTDRILEYTQELLKNLKKDECIILVTHQRPLRTIIDYFGVDSSNVEYCQIVQLKKQNESLDNCELSVY